MYLATFSSLAIADGYSKSDMLSMDYETLLSINPEGLSKKQNRWHTKILKDKYPEYELSLIQSEVEQQIQQLNFLPQPDTFVLIGLLKDYFKWTLKDPDSLKDLEVMNVEKCYVSVNPKIELRGDLVWKSRKMRKKGIHDYTDFAPKHDFGHWCVTVRYRAKNSYGGYVVGGGIYSYLNEQIYLTDSISDAFDSRGEEKRFSWDEDSFIREGYVAEYLEPLFLDRGYSFLRRVDDPLNVRVIKF